ncbi:MAG: fatty acid desaturase [Verrucomicrobiales bacterium]
MSAQNGRGSFTPWAPWVNRAAFPIISGCFYLSQALLAYSVYRGWLWISVALVLIVSHLMHGVLIGFHEATHGTLRRNRFLNELNGTVMGMISYNSFTLYRVLHQSHHVHFATERDVELWPFVETDAPLWKRRLVVFVELNFGLIFTPFLFWRAFFCRNSEVRNPRIRRRIWLELGLALVFWIVTFTLVIHFALWPWFFWNYLIPAFITGNLQSWRKYIEHVGMSGNTARSGTRSIVTDTWAGRLISLSLLHEPLHGIHHLAGKLPHSDMPEHTDWLTPEEEGDSSPFPSYRAAFADLIRRLPDPRVGSQWKAVEPAVD